MAFDEGVHNRVWFVTVVQASAIVFSPTHKQMSFGYKCSMYEFKIEFPYLVFSTNFSHNVKSGLLIRVL